MLAIQQERNAVLAILDISGDDCVTTLHFDATSRKRINREWLSVIMRTKDGKKFRIYLLIMAVEIRDNVTSMTVAALKRLSVASGADSKELWEKVSALMTDSVAKNLHIKEVKQCLHNINDDIEKKHVLGVEILYHHHSSGSDTQQRPHLYKVNQLSLTEMKVNIATLLTNNFVESLNIPPIPSEDEVVQLLSLQQNPAY